MAGLFMQTEKRWLQLLIFGKGATLLILRGWIDKASGADGHGVYESQPKKKIQLLRPD